MFVGVVGSPVSTRQVMYDRHYFAGNLIYGFVNEVTTVALRP